MSPRLPLLLCLPLALAAVPARGAVTESFTQVQRVSQEGMEGLCGLCISPDGKYVYAVGLQSNRISTFAVDPESGQLSPKSELDITDASFALGVKISGNGKYVAASAWGSGSITLYSRDTETGRLTESAQVDSTTLPSLARAAECQFSPDGSFLYVAALNGSITVLSTAGGKLTEVENVAEAGVTDGARGIAIDPEGNFVAVCAQYADCVSVFTRDAKTGKLKLLGYAKEGEKGVSGIKGPFRATFSPDGKFLYTSSGRFGGSDAVSVFLVDEDVKIEHKHTLEVGRSSGINWKGGNSIAVSPVKGDHRVLATASVSDSIALLQRNPETGDLGFAGSSTAGTEGSPGVAGICFSPDGRFIYAADEDEGALFVYSAGQPPKK